ncbi:ribosomal protein S18-alanine N-acetyltransferase [Herbaspirillum sp. alder98]|uniref:ribosomal protein S18-alanine N-acetyltransferase n=1 Tax=Herbaspirillum sp. alder98 TaxID=2913096 RepID=UPI001CD8C43E|nr:ribosomal protein S18-alanine N-acetyltransferase [Herbaspirillum sp. alder98]MCA1323491.1 ribosomal protein S18-alanine N-acetyltransferase [Herbaspirillum sp. alder98]
MTPAEAAALEAGLQARFGVLELAPMTVDEVDAVVAIENAVYSHPWTRGNFLDSLYSGYQAYTLRDGQGSLLGYFLVMQAVDEAHLLNISVAQAHQHQGLGRLLLWRAGIVARQLGMQRMLLEVRESNGHAFKVYQRYGFTEIGRRKNYYPAVNNAREGAIVMSLPL